MPIVSFAGSTRGMENGTNGLVIPDGDTPALADAADRILSDQDLASKLGSAARDYAERNGDWLMVARKIEKVFRAILQGPAVSAPARD